MRLLERHCATVRHEMTEAVSSYGEKPRDQWVFDFPAQVALCGTQIWWTTEVNIAFGRLEEGYENALKDYNKKQVGQFTTIILTCFMFMCGYESAQFWCIRGSFYYDFYYLIT